MPSAVSRWSQRSIPACAGQPGLAYLGQSGTRVDPRVRGAATIDQSTASPDQGRSPRARGSQGVRHRAAWAWGSIPACAGQPSFPCYWSWPRQVDPRVRGAAHWSAALRLACGGRSPRARGSLFSRLLHMPTAGSIPACAGQPLNSLPFFLPSWVDPRVRGAARGLHAASGSRQGRSPRARGSLPLRANSKFIPGSIPACAGQPLPCRCTSNRLGVDPRVRGAAAAG